MHIVYEMYSFYTCWLKALQCLTKVSSEQQEDEWHKYGHDSVLLLTLMASPAGRHHQALLRMKASPADLCYMDSAYSEPGVSPL
jgi:hypothetical protein